MMGSASLPSCVDEPDKYEVVFATDRIKYLRKDGLITTKTEIIVTKNHHAEIRKITFTNESNDFKILELTTYTEPILSENTADIAHRTFNSMFLKTSYLGKYNSLVVERKSRTSNINSYMVNRLLIENPLDKYTYETDRFNFLGRNNTYSNPKIINDKLTNFCFLVIFLFTLVNTNIEIAPIINGKITTPIYPKSYIYA